MWSQSTRVLQSALPWLLTRWRIAPPNVVMNIPKLKKWHINWPHSKYGFWKFWKLQNFNLDHNSLLASLFMAEICQVAQVVIPLGNPAAQPSRFTSTATKALVGSEAEVPAAGDRYLAIKHMGTSPIDDEQMMIKMMTVHLRLPNGVLYVQKINLRRLVSAYLASKSHGKYVSKQIPVSTSQSDESTGPVGFFRNLFTVIHWSIGSRLCIDWPRG